MGRVTQTGQIVMGKREENVVIEIGVAVEAPEGVGDVAAVAEARRKLGEVGVVQEIVTEGVDARAVAGVEAVQEAQTEGAKAMIREKDVIEKEV